VVVFQERAGVNTNRGNWLAVHFPSTLAAKQVLTKVFERRVQTVFQQPYLRGNQIECLAMEIVLHSVAHQILGCLLFFLYDYFEFCWACL
jgi:hypothetical protein